MVFFHGPFAAAEMIRLVGCCAFLFACPCFVIERFCATIFLKSYETMRHNRIIGFVIALQWGSACLAVYCFCNRVIKTSILVGIFGVIMIFTILAFVLMSYGSGNFLQPCLKAIFDYSVVFYGYIFPLISVTSVPDLKISYIVWLIRFRRKIFPQILPSNGNEAGDTRKKLKHLKNSKGKQMVFTLDQEMAVYYSALNEMWSEDLKSRRPLRYTPTKYRY
uniref:Uncharacterized protein n=1 Tax=Panagrolaimus davidi TaxID=227884 RepID=A0A914Q747_9BILA